MDLQTLKQKMDEAHYIYDDTLATVLYVALTLGRPLLIEGAAGVGKTEISLRVAEKLGCAIVSSDSRQIYRETKIGTAAPTEAELARVKHHFIGTRSITEHYSSGQYELDALPIRGDCAMWLCSIGGWFDAVYRCYL